MTLMKEIPVTDFFPMIFMIWGSLMTAPPVTKPYPMILVAVWGNNVEIYHFQAVEVEPVCVGEEGVVALSCEDQVLVLDCSQDFFFC